MYKTGIAMLAGILLAGPAIARDSLGIFGTWGAFRDAASGRCYAIAVPQPDRSDRKTGAFASVGTWPGRGVRGQLHLRLSRPTGPRPAITMAIAGQRLPLTGTGSNAWAMDRAGDAAAVAAMRSAARFSVSATDQRGRRFTDRYDLSGAATALDAASIGCARPRR